MNSYKRLILSASFAFLTGCTTMSNKDIYKEGYQRGVHEQIKQVAGEFQGGNFPFYHWSSPIVQSVKIPAHLTNGVMIPAHDELVIIKPGEWAMSPGYPIQNQKRNNYENQNSSSDLDVSNLTALPASVGKSEGSYNRISEASSDSRRMEQSAR